MLPLITEGEIETMVATTNLATLLQNIFQKFAGQAGSGTHGTTVACWRATLNSGETGPEFLEELALIQGAIVRLKRQVADSKILDDQSRAVANSAIAGFHQCVQPEVFHTPPKTHQSHYNGDRLGMLGLLSSTLQIEFPEAALSDNEIEELSQEIDELVAEIRAATEIPVDLKHILLRHAQFMAWAIRNADLVGAEGIFDAIGKMIIAANRLSKDSENLINGSKPKLRERAVSICAKIGKVLAAADKIDRGLQALEHLQEKIPHLLS